MSSRGRGAVVLGSAVALGAAAAALGSARWNRTAARTAGHLFAAHESSHGAHTGVFTPGQLTGLPEPVARYFAFALTPGQPPIRQAHLWQTGELRMPSGSRWRRFEAVQHVAVDPRGFLWDATIPLAPLLSVRVLDGYVDGQGLSRARAAGLLPLGDRRGTPELASASLLRWLAEAVWWPTALLPSAGVTWTGIDGHAARATLVDRGTRVSLDFRFGPRGEMVGCSGWRHRDVNGRAASTRWAGRYHDYERVGGMMVPMAAEVEWILPEGALPCWRGRIVDVGYAFASPGEG